MKNLVISLICLASLTTFGQNSLQFQLNSTSIQKLNFVEPYWEMIDPAKGLIPEWRWAEMQLEIQRPFNFGIDTMLLYPQDTTAQIADTIVTVTIPDSFWISQPIIYEPPQTIAWDSIIFIQPWEPYDPWGGWGSLVWYTIIAERQQTNPHRIYAYQELENITVEAIQFENQICVRIDAKESSWMDVSLKRLKEKGIAMPLHTGVHQFNVPQGYHELFFDIEILQNATFLAEVSQGDVAKTCRVETRSALVAEDLPTRTVPDTE